MLPLSFRGWLPLIGIKVEKTKSIVESFGEKESESRSTVVSDVIRVPGLLPKYVLLTHSESKNSGNSRCFSVGVATVNVNHGE